MKTIPDEPDYIESEICRRLDSLISNKESYQWTITEWTKQVKGAVAELGKNLGFYVCASRCEPRDWGEFLVDVCWLNYEGENLATVPLALESEWGPNDADDDFLKLTIIRAEHRVMIFTVPTNTNRDEAFQSLLKYVITCKHSLNNDRYLLCCWNNEERGFDYRVFIVV